MPDLRQQRDTARNERDRALRELADLHAIVGWIDPAYAAALRDADDLAHNGLRRPDDLGQPVNSGHASSKPPSHDARAYDLLRKERKWQRDQADALAKKIMRLVDGAFADEAPATPFVPKTATPIRRSPSQTAISPTRPFATVSFSVRRAPLSAPNTEPA